MDRTLQDPARYLVIIEQDGAMLARMYDAQRRQIIEFDAASEEVAVMLAGLEPVHDGTAPTWDAALRGHNRHEREQAQVYELDV
jgi:hypothetical protein